jgi:hypothetical protein
MDTRKLSEMAEMLKSEIDAQNHSKKMEQMRRTGEYRLPDESSPSSTGVRSIKDIEAKLAEIDAQEAATEPAIKAMEYDERAKEKRRADSADELMTDEEKNAKYPAKEPRDDPRESKFDPRFKKSFGPLKSRIPEE